MAVDLPALGRRDFAKGSSPSASPDGRFVAYVANPYERRDEPLPKDVADRCGERLIVLRDLATGKETEFESDFSRAQFFELYWSPDSGMIASATLGADVAHAVVLDITSGGWGGAYESEEIYAAVRPGLGVGKSPRGWTPTGELVMTVYAYPLGNIERDVTAIGPRGPCPAGLAHAFCYVVDNVKGPYWTDMTRARTSAASLRSINRQDAVQISGKTTVLPVFSATWPASTEFVEF